MYEEREEIEEATGHRGKVNGREGGQKETVFLFFFFVFSCDSVSSFDW